MESQQSDGRSLSERVAAAGGLVWMPRESPADPEFWERSDNEMIRQGFDWYLVEREDDECPPFRFPTCETCLFAIEPGTEAVRCFIRRRPIVDVIHTYCANHPELNPEGVEVPLGPMYGVSHDHNEDSCIYAQFEHPRPESPEELTVSYDRPQPQINDGSQSP